MFGLQAPLVGSRCECSLPTMHHSAGICAPLSIRIFMPVLNCHLTSNLISLPEPHHLHCYGLPHTGKILPRPFTLLPHCNSPFYFERHAAPAITLGITWRSTTLQVPQLPPPFTENMPTWASCSITIITALTQSLNHDETSRDEEGTREGQFKDLTRGPNVRYGS